MKRALLALLLAATLALAGCGSGDWEKACRDKDGRIDRDRETRTRYQPGTNGKSGHYAHESRKVLYCVDKSDGHEITEPYEGWWS